MVKLTQLKNNQEQIIDCNREPTTLGIVTLSLKFEEEKNNIIKAAKMPALSLSCPIIGKHELN